MTSRSALAVLAVLLVPGWALAGEMGSALGFAGQWSASTVGYARSLFPAVLIGALVAEIVFRDPSAAPSFRNSLWRALIVLALLAPVGGQTLYGRVCGVFAGLSDSMASTLGPADPWADFEATAERWQKQLADAKAADEDGSVAAQLGGVVFASLVALALLLGQGALWVMSQFASVLVVLLYALGPLAIVFWIPLKSDSLGRWLRTFLTVLTWPVMSAVILAIITRASLRGLDGASPAFASLATALLLGVTAFAVPVVSSSLVGGSMGAIGAGMSTVMQTAGLGAAAASSALGSTVGGGGGGAALTLAARGAQGPGQAGAPGSAGLASNQPPGTGGASAPGITPNSLDVSAGPAHRPPAANHARGAVGAAAASPLAVTKALPGAAPKAVGGAAANPIAAAQPPPPPPPSARILRPRPRAVPLADQPTAPSKPWPNGTRPLDAADNPVSAMLRSSGDVPPEGE